MPKLKPVILVGGLPRAGKSTFISRIAPLLPQASIFKEKDYVNQVNPYGRDYALDYKENAEFLVGSAMIKDAAEACRNHKAIIVESNYFVDIKMRAAYRKACLTRNHLPIYVSVYVPEKVRENNRVLDKYSQDVNSDLIGRNRRPRRDEGFLVMSVREVITYLKERNGIT